MKMFKCNKRRKHYDSNYVHKDTLQKQAYSQYVCTCTNRKHEQRQIKLLSLAFDKTK